MDLRILGAREFFLLAADCRGAARRDLAREVKGALGSSVKPATAAIKQAAMRTMPERGGYRRVLVPALKVQPQARSAFGLRLVISARGRSELRDVKALDRGQLRHPVFGKRRNPWVVTSIRPGFATDTFEKQADAIVARLGEALGAVANEIAGG